MPRQTSTPLPQLIYPRVIHLQKRIEKLVYDKRDTPATTIGPVHDKHVPLEKAVNEKFEIIEPGDVFSPAKAGIHDEFPWTHRWFKVEIPEAADGEEANRFLHFVANGEFTVYYNGRPWCGIDPCHPRCFLPESTEPMTLWIDAGQWQTGFWFGLDPPDEHGFRLMKCDLEVRNHAAFETYHDLSMLVEVVERHFDVEGIEKKTENGFYQPLDKIDPRVRRLLKLLNDACDLFDRYGLTKIRSALKSIYKEFPADSHSMTVSYVGHAHMDLVWLWPERVTYRKIIHTYSTMLRLMERYPEMVFTMSQPPLIHHIAEKEPELASEIKERIIQKKWEFTGGLEVEADTQIPVGEGLARSLIYGQERIANFRGEVSNTVWIPDVFGYSQCLPQLFALGGIKNFYTTKILWSTITKFPHNSFVWKSPDGSEVLTHLAVSGYNCEIKIDESCNAARDYKQADVHDELLCASGYGDGGGGLTEDHCERARRLQDLSGAPRSRWSSVEEFFDRLSLVSEELPRYRGELFLEYHRGVHTTQSVFKANLRACERSLQTREALRVLSGAGPLSNTDWLRYLFAHFHDATPGSSINTVYKELNPELESIAEGHMAATREEWPSGGDLVIFNPILWRRWATVELPSKVNALKSVDGEVYAVQKCNDKYIARVQLDGICGCAFIPVGCPLKKTMKTVDVLPTSLDNGRLRAEFDFCTGYLKSLSVDGEELYLDKAGGYFTLHDDNPAAFDAWDLDHHVVWMKETVFDKPLQLQIEASGPALGILEGSCKVGNSSTMTIRYILEAHSEALKVECDVDWQETNKTLRYEVATQYRGEYARYGAPFGSVDRSQKEGGHKEEAQWEVPGSRWASVLDGRNRGLSIITEAKYGFRARDGILGVSLLRSPTFPDPVADKGKHRICFAIAPHRDDFGACGEASTAGKADELYTGPVLIENAKPAGRPPITFLRLDSVVPSWVMPSRSYEDSFLVRMHEVAGGRSTVRFKISNPFVAVTVVDLNEDHLPAAVRLDQDQGEFTFVVAPYKIVTLKISKSMTICIDT